jgi:biopolymer transport protein ExbD
MRRRRFFAGGHQQVELNVIPLIDVVFFLLVFYVISTSFTTESAVQVERPQSSRAATSEIPAVQVAVTAVGEILVGSRTVGLADLSGGVAAELARSAATRVVLIADRSVPTGTLLAVMDACTAGGAASVDVAATAGPAR